MSRKPKPPVEVGARVTSTYRVPPFYADEVLIVVEATRIGRGKAATWRAKCRSNRGVEGWLDVDTLVPWELGERVLAFVTANPGATDNAIRAELADAHPADVITALQLLTQWGDITRRAPYGEHYARGAAPACTHSHVRSQNGSNDCLNCGATRAWSSTRWNEP